MTPRPEASDAPDIVEAMRQIDNFIAQSERVSGHVNGISGRNLKDWKAALAALRAELAAVQDTADALSGERDEWREGCRAAEAEVARLKDENKNSIRLSPAEIQSGHDRVKWAQGLIEQIPNNHNGRNSWLLNYGVREEYDAKRKERDLCMDPGTKSARSLTAAKGG